MARRYSVASLFLLVIAFLIYSVSGIFSKMASLEVFLSAEYLSCFASVILSIGIYAILWQFILKQVPLAQAFLFKSLTIIFGLFFAYAFFDETISWQNVIGASFIISGIIMNALSVKT